MECAELRVAILRGEIPPAAEVRAHTAACPACAELLAGGGELGRSLAEVSAPAEVDLGPLWAEVKGSIARESGILAWLRSRATPLRVAMALGAVVAACVYQLLFSRRADLHVYPLGAMLTTSGVYALVIGLTLGTALRPLHRPKPIPWLMPALIVAALLLPFAFSGQSPAHENHPASLLGRGADLVPRAFACFVYGGIVAAPILWLVWALDRGEHRSTQVALLAAGGAGLAANLALQLHCPSTQPVHLLPGHAAIGVALMVAYLAFRRSVASRR